MKFNIEPVFHTSQLYSYNTGEKGHFARTKIFFWYICRIPSMCLFFPSRPHPPLEIFFERQCIAPTKWTFFFVLTDCEILINNFYIQIDEKK